MRNRVLKNGEERQERPGDEVETEAVDEDRQEDRPPEDDLPDEERLVLEARRPAAPVGAREEEEAGPDDDDRPDEDEVDRERIESRSAAPGRIGEGPRSGRGTPRRGRRASTRGRRRRARRRRPGPVASAFPPRW